MSEIQEKCIWPEKKNEKSKKKIYFGIASKSTKVIKNPKTRFLAQYWAIFTYFQPKFEMVIFW